MPSRVNLGCFRTPFGPKIREHSDPFGPQIGMHSDSIRFKNSGSSDPFGPLRTPNWDASFGHIRTPFGPQTEMHSDPARALIRMHSDSKLRCLDSGPRDLLRQSVRSRFRRIFCTFWGNPTRKPGAKHPQTGRKKSANGRNFKMCPISL